jgi:uncharacterized protein
MEATAGSPVAPASIDGSLLAIHDGSLPANRGATIRCVPDPLWVAAPVARRFLILRQFLAPPRSLPPEPESVLAVVDRLGSLQFDPLGVAGRNHDLVLHARIAGYRPAWTDDLLYRRRLLFEALNKGLSILPTRELPWYRHTWDRHALTHGDGIFAQHTDAVEAVLARLRAEGPLSSLDFERERAIDWYWGPTSRVRAVLEALSEAGIVGLARRDGNRRYYDLIERLQPAELLEQRVPEAEQVRHRLLSRFRGHGLLGTAGSGELWHGTAPARRTGLFPGHNRTELVSELVERGELTPLQVDGVRGSRYLLTDELGLLAQAGREVAGTSGGAVSRRPESDTGPESATGLESATRPESDTGPGGTVPAVTFLAPLDPLAWDRGLLRSLFGFDYVWEVYVPAAKRRWGYYVLPVLFGDRFVGRIEPRIDRVARRVRILGTWWEPGFDPLETPGFVPALAAALDAYAAFAGAVAVTWPRTKAARALAHAVVAARP